MSESELAGAEELVDASMANNETRRPLNRGCGDALGRELKRRRGRPRKQCNAEFNN
jgi:hypothetical protein